MFRKFALSKAELNSEVYLDDCMGKVVFLTSSYVVIAWENGKVTSTHINDKHDFKEKAIVRSDGTWLYRGDKVYRGHTALVIAARTHDMLQFSDQSVTIMAGGDMTLDKNLFSLLPRKRTIIVRGVEIAAPVQGPVPERKLLYYPSLTAFAKFETVMFFDTEWHTSMLKRGLFWEKPEDAAAYVKALTSK